MADFWKPDTKKVDDEISLWDEVAKFGKDFIRELPISPFYYKSEAEKTQIENRETLQAWSDANDIPFQESWITSQDNNPVIRRSSPSMNIQFPWTKKEPIGELPNSSPTHRLFSEWIAPGIALGGLPTGLAAWRAASTLPMASKIAIRAAAAPGAVLEKIPEAGGKIISKLAGKVVPYLREAMPHLDPTMNPTKARPILNHIANGLAKDIGGAKPLPSVITKASTKESLIDKSLHKLYSITNRTYRMERMTLQMDRYVENGGFTQAFVKPVEQSTDKFILSFNGELQGIRDNLAKQGTDIFKVMKGASLEFRPGEFMTPGEKIGVYLNSKNPDNLRHMIVGNKLNSDDVLGIIKSLTPEERAVADLIGEATAGRYKQIASSYYQATGKSLKQVENYWPIKVRSDVITAKERQMTFEEMLAQEENIRFAGKWASSKISKGMTKLRSDKAVNPIELDAFQVYLRSLQEGYHYINFSPVVRDIQSLINNPNLKKSIVDNFGKARWEVMEQWTKDVAQTDPYKLLNKSEEILRLMRVNGVTASLGLNVITGMKQLPSFISGMAEIGEIPAIRGPISSIANPKETAELIRKLSPQIYKRTFEREIAEAKALHAIDALGGKMDWRSAFMFLTTTADKIAVRGLWRGGFDDAMKGMTPKIAKALGVSEKTQMTSELAAKYAERAIRRTQPFFNVKDVPEYWRAGEGFKMLTTFTNQLNQYWNYMRFDIIGKAHAGEISKLEATRRIFDGFVIPAYLIGWITRSTPADDIKEFSGDMGMMATSMIPLVGSFISSAMKGFKDSSGSITTEFASKLQEAAYYAAEGTPEKIAKPAMEAAGYGLGIPTGQPRRTIEGLLDIAQGKTDDWLRLIWSEYNRTTEAETRTRPRIKSAPERNTRTRPRFKGTR
jgi:hypothetical protein